MTRYRDGATFNGWPRSTACRSTCSCPTTGQPRSASADQPAALRHLDRTETTTASKCTPKQGKRGAPPRPAPPYLTRPHPRQSERSSLRIADRLGLEWSPSCASWWPVWPTPQAERENEVAWQLVDEVLHLAPANLTEGQRLVLLAIASEVHQADLASRRCTVAVAHLAHLTGMTRGGVTSAMTHLRDRHGLDVRVPISLTGGRGGGPLYTVTGQLPTFRVPPLLSTRECACGSCAARRARASVADPPIGGSTVEARGSAVEARGSTVEARGSTVEARGSTVADPLRVSGITGLSGGGRSAAVDQIGPPHHPAGPPTPEQQAINRRGSATVQAALEEALANRRRRATHANAIPEDAA